MTNTESKVQKVAYIRVSTFEQNIESQREILEQYGIDTYFEEKISAKDTNRPQLLAMMNYVRKGDTVFIKDFSRLARSTKDLLWIIEKLDNKGVKLVSHKENLDTSTPTGKLMITMLGAIYEFERANLLERQKDGIAVAKKQGKYKGRKKIQKPSNWDEIYIQWSTRKITGKKACEILNLKTNTFYNFVKDERKEIHNG
ncbi:recombinase family protein [bacterium]|nr:recombinase family protein [bacterium]